MNSLTEHVVAKKIRGLASSSEAANRLFEIFARRKKDSKQMTVERAAKLAACDYRSMTQIFKELDEIGVGKFVVGRRGHPSRIEWSYSIQSLGEIAEGQIDQPQEISSHSDIDDEIDDELEEASNLQHEFQLRDDFKIKLSLPNDLNPKEAERLALFIKAIPF